MQLKITQEGFENFTGFIGNVEFEGGVSVDHVGKLEAETLAGLYSVEEYVPAKAEEKSKPVEEPPLPTAGNDEAKDETEAAGKERPQEAAE